MPLVLNSSGGGSVTLAAPSTASNVTLTAPASNATLITTASSGQIIPKAAMPAGSVLQVASVTLTSAFSYSAGTLVWGDVSVLNITITPTSSTSKFYLMANLQVGRGSFSSYFRFAGGNSASFIGDAASNRPSVGAASSPSDDTYSNQNILALGMVYLDSPATTSPITYKVQCAPQVDFRTVYINRSGTDRDASNYDPRTASSFTIMEIAA